MSTTNPPGTGGIPDPIPAGVGADPASIARGHETDDYDSKSVLSVPLLVVVFFIAAFATVSAVFWMIAYPEPEPGEHPLATERNLVHMNERMGRITRGGEVDQPRLEDLKLRTGDARVMTQPEMPTGNSPWVHPEDIRPSPTVTPTLFETRWADPNKTYARVSLGLLMDLNNEALGKLFPVQAAQSRPLDSPNRPTAANAGRGGGPSVAAPPKLPEPEAPKVEGKK